MKRTVPTLAVPEPQDKWAGGVVTILIRRSGGIARTTVEMYVENMPSQFN